MTRITDKVRIDWLAENKADTQYVSGKVGPGWIREAGWRVFVRNRLKGDGLTLRQAVDVAMKAEQAKES